jgi:transcriptional regulator with XRE-family HTH domain
MCNLLEKAREAQGNISYYEVCKRLGVSTPLMNQWKNNKSKPNGYHTLKLAEMANIDIKEALKLYESGFSNLSLLFVTASLSIALLASNYDAIHCILC